MKKINKTPCQSPKPGMKKRSFAGAIGVIAVTLVLGSDLPILAAADPLESINSLSELIFGIIKGIGLIMLAFGAVQIGLSMKNHDPSGRAQSYLVIAGGLIIFFSKEIINMIT